MHTKLNYILNIAMINVSSALGCQDWHTKNKKKRNETIEFYMDKIDQTLYLSCNKYTTRFKIVRIGEYM